MKTISRILNVMIVMILITCTSVVMSSSHINKNNTPILNTDNEKPAAETVINNAPVTVLPVAEITTSQFDEPRYWVNYLETTVQPELDTFEFSGVLNEMYDNPTYWVDYLKTVESFE